MSLVDAGMTYEEVGRRLQVQPGLAYLLATGLPADGSDAPSATARERTAVLGTSQHLSSPQPAGNPTSKDSVHEWLQRRVAADDAMQLAAARRRPASPLHGDREGDAVDLLTQEHNHVTSLLKRLATIPGVRKGGTPTQLATRRALADEVATELAPHLRAEDRLLWPAVRDALSDGDDLAGTGEQMGRHGLEVLDRLDGLGPDTEEFDDCIEEVSAASRKHVAFTDRVFLDLREAMDRDALLALGAQVEAKEQD